MSPASVRQALAIAQKRLAAAGVEDAGRDARRLMEHALGLERGRLVLHLEDPLDPAAAGRFAAAIDAREARQPVAQIIGSRAFWGRDFRVTSDVLDPRPETEGVVEAALEAPYSRILDLGTGSGCLLLTCLAERPDARGLGTDISEAALAVARGNAQALGLADRAGFQRANWCEGLTGTFDLIVSNPPYIGLAELATLTPEVRDWEPAGALSPGADPLAAYRCIAAGLGAALAPRGRVIVECGAGQGTTVAAIFAGAGLVGTEIRPDLEGRDRVVLARMPG